MQEENVEQQIFLQPEGVQVSPVTSVNGQTGDVVLTTSDLENTSDYQTGSDLSNAISTHNSDEEAHPYIQGIVNGKQDKLTAGTNVNISDQNVISATDTTYSAGNGINISGENAISIDTTVVATQQNLSNEVTNRENADIYLQQQIDGISASSDVVDIVGTYAELQQYDTQHLKDNDIIKVLQDETQGGATTYYRWSTSTSTFTLIGQEGPYYTKAAADAEFVPQTRTVNGKALSANITLNASDVSALGTSDVVQTTGSSTSQVMSQNAVTTQLNTKLNISDYVVDDQLANTTNPVQNQVLNGLLGNMPTNFFSGSATTNPTADTSVEVTDALVIDDYELLGNTTQQTYSGKNLLDASTYTNNYIDGNGIIQNGGGTNGLFSYMPVTPNTQYTMSANTSFRMNFVFYDNNKTFISRDQTNDYTTARTVSTPANCYFIRAFIFLSTGVDQTVINNASLQVESGSTATPWEKFVGGIPSPNPDYPQAINVVTGEQTVTISDGTNTQSYTINLGSIELCKIGTYQDYIYKSGDDWYVHKDIGKNILDGSQTITTYNNASAPNGYFYVVPVSPNALYSTTTKGADVMSNAFTAVQNAVPNFATGKMSIKTAGDGVCFGFKGTNAEFDTYLTNNPASLYYALATPTDTKITDANLIGQLEALKNASVYAGTTYFEVSASDLAAILDLTAVNANAQGIIYKLRGN